MIYQAVTAIFLIVLGVASGVLGVSWWWFRAMSKPEEFRGFVRNAVSRSCTRTHILEGEETCPLCDTRLVSGITSKNVDKNN